MIKNYSLKQRYIHDSDWKDIYTIERKIYTIITEVYFGKIVARCEIDDLYTIKTEFQIHSNNYEYMISRRGNNFGFCISALNNNNKYTYSKISQNTTIENNKFYLYNIYKKLFIVLENK